MSVSPKLDGTIGASDTTRAPSRRDSVRVADQIVSVLRRHGIDRVFGIPGGTISPLFDALIDTDIEVIPCQHETMAAYIASGYARTTGRPGVVMVTSGPGALNAITGVAAANLDEAPMLLLAGEISTSRAGAGALQDGGAAGLDLNSMFRPITKYTEAVMRPERAPAAVQQALASISTAPSGAAFLSLPVDVTQAGRELGEVSATHHPRLAPDASLCAGIARCLSRAVRPAIMLGVGARRPGVAEKITALAEWLRCPVFTDIEGKGLFPESHPLSLGVFGVGHRGKVNEYLAERPDVLLTIGARLDDTTTLTHSDILRPRETFIQLDHAAHRLGRAYQVDVSAQCDLEATIALVAEMCPMPSMQTILARDAAVRAITPQTAPETISLSRAPHDPALVVRALQHQLGPEAVFTTDIGNHLVFASQNLIIDRPGGFFAGIGLGGMGSGLGNAIGMQLALGPSARVVSICGDGTISMVGNEIATCVERGIPLTVVVMNDRRWGMVDDGMTSLYGRSPGCDLPPLDVVRWAQSLGATAKRVENDADLLGALSPEMCGPSCSSSRSIGRSRQAIRGSEPARSKAPTMT